MFTEENSWSCMPAILHISTQTDSLMSVDAYFRPLACAALDIRISQGSVVQPVICSRSRQTDFVNADRNRGTYEGTWYRIGPWIKLHPYFLMMVANKKASNGPFVRAMLQSQQGFLQGFQVPLHLHQCGKFCNNLRKVCNNLGKIFNNLFGKFATTLVKLATTYVQFATTYVSLQV